MRLATDRSRTDIKPALSLHLPKIGSHKTSSSNEAIKQRPSWIYGARRFRRFRHCCQQRPRFRGFIPLPVGAHRRRISPRAASLALLGFILPGAFPSLASACRLSRSVSRPPAATPSAFCLSAEMALARPPLAFRGSTLSGTVPCASSFKELGSWLASFETAGP